MSVPSKTSITAIPSNDTSIALDELFVEVLLSIDLLLINAKAVSRQRYIGGN